MTGMTSRERIKKTLEFKIPDRIGISDDFTDEVVQDWKNGGRLAKDETPQEHFDFDIRLFGFDQTFREGKKDVADLGRMNFPSIGGSLIGSYESADKAQKFLTLSCMEPFEHVSAMVGKENLLGMMAEEAGKASDLFAGSLGSTLDMCRLILDKGYRFDGAWLWGDLGYKKGPMFSTDYYNAFLFDAHKEFCDFFSGNGMPVILHSDGNIGELIPYLIEAGVRAIEPLESDTGMDVSSLKAEYGKDIVLFGGIDERSFTDRKKSEKEIRVKFKHLMKGGGYIYHADGPIFKGVGFEDYKYVIETVKKYGSY